MQMKTVSKHLIIRFVILGMVILGGAPLCSANPFSKVFSIFQTDLVITIVYEDHGNLIQGSEVYLAEDPEGEKVLIGKVTKISLNKPGRADVEVRIHKDYKEKIVETTRFVLMDGFFSETSTSYVLALPFSDPSESSPLTSGSSIRGLTFFEYKLHTAGQGLKTLIDRFKSQNEKILDQFEGYAQRFDTEAFQSQMDELIDTLSNFSSEQKKTFKKQVLPHLRELFESIMTRLEAQNKNQKSKELENQLLKMEKAVDV
jgi:hypothetical protein